SWIARQLRDAGYPKKNVILPLKIWALGDWTLFLEDQIASAEKIIVVLSLSYLSSRENFVQVQRRMVL
ncbi:MAG: toll/interleukin-1 receptor domain-containing protein, partial [Chloroflexota bacterium]|nr:toll/interleukin-1 receptor domain-containing protein [Chloroflexota bacterium]